MLDFEASENKFATTHPFRVWHCPQVPGPMFHVYVETLPEAILVQETLAFYDDFQYMNKIKPDYSNSSGIEHAEKNPEDDTYEWYSVDRDPGETTEEEYRYELSRTGSVYTCTSDNFVYER